MEHNNFPVLYNEASSRSSRNHRRCYGSSKFNISLFGQMRFNKKTFLKQFKNYPLQPNFSGAPGGFTGQPPTGFSGPPAGCGGFSGRPEGGRGGFSGAPNGASGRPTGGEMGGDGRRERTTTPSV